MWVHAHRNLGSRGLALSGIRRLDIRRPLDFLAVTDHAFIEEYTQSVIEQKRAEGVTGAELAQVVEEQEAMKENYAKLYYRLPITFIEIFPVALLITLISAAILRKREVMPAHAT